MPCQSEAFKTVSGDHKVALRTGAQVQVERVNSTVMDELLHQAFACTIGHGHITTPGLLDVQPHVHAVSSITIVGGHSRCNGATT